MRQDAVLHVSHVEACGARRCDQSTAAAAAEGKMLGLDLDVILDPLCDSEVVKEEPARRIKGESQSFLISYQWFVACVLKICEQRHRVHRRHGFEKGKPTWHRATPEARIQGMQEEHDELSNLDVEEIFLAENRDLGRVEPEVNIQVPIPAQQGEREDRESNASDCRVNQRVQTSISTTNVGGLEPAPQDDQTEVDMQSAVGLELLLRDARHSVQKFDDVIVIMEAHHFLHQRR
mmetsp:Transcript_11757/g.32621  ORF Transcript_11757/g.32621 Transcript_11757/m.32621 type:complete len:234 (+) Transcript_11757:294-995(+)